MLPLPAGGEDASMRPPEFTGGNHPSHGVGGCGVANGFNEAAGIHRRKRRPVTAKWTGPQQGFNEAAGIHRRKRDAADSTLYAYDLRFNEAAGIHRRKPQPEREEATCRAGSFNEAAGIHRRKHYSPTSNPSPAAALQ